jgi:hypothetical protein
VSEEKRRAKRLRCFLPAELLKAGGKQAFVDKTTIQDFSRDGLKLAINFNLNPGSQVELKLFLPEKKLSTSLSAEIMWSKCSGNKMEVGLKINNMDQRAKDEVLNWFYPAWLKEERKPSRNKNGQKK